MGEFQPLRPVDRHELHASDRVPLLAYRTQRGMVELNCPGFTGE